MADQARETPLSLLAVRELKQLRRHASSPIPGAGAALLDRARIIARMALWAVRRALGRAAPRPAESGYAAVKASGLFDADFYFDAYPDLRGLKIDPLLHYLRHGVADRRRPNSEFVGDAYLRLNPDAATAGLNPLAHYALVGAREGRRPTPAFRPDDYLAAHPAVREAGVNPLAHALLVAKWSRGPIDARAPGGATASLIEAAYRKPLPLALDAPEPRLVFLMEGGLGAEPDAGAKLTLDLACRAAECGLPVRIATTVQDFPVGQATELRRFLAEVCGLKPSADKLIDVDSAEGGGVAAHAADIFVATCWRTAMRLQQTLREGGFAQEQHYYLIRDHEPGAYAWSEEHALALSMCRSGLRPIVFTAPLAARLRAETGMETDPALVAAPEIDTTFRAPAAALRRAARRIVLDASPRGLFGSAVIALRHLVRKRRLDPAQVEVVSVGEPHDPVDLGRGLILESMGRLDAAARVNLLYGSDIGLSLTLSPAPGTLALEFAAAGVTTVSTLADDFRPAANMIACTTDIDSIAAALDEALDWVGAARVDAKFDLSLLGRPLVTVAAALAAETKPKLEAAALRLAGEWPERLGIGYRVLKPATMAAGARACLFSHFDAQNQIDPHVRRYLRALKDEGFATVLVTSCPTLDADSLKASDALCAGVIARENRGYDFAGWALAHEIVAGLRQCKEILVANDSLYGPMRPLSAVFETMRDRPCDFWGLTETFELERHLQSFFLLFRAKAVQSEAYWRFWRGVRPLPGKEAVIRAYEATMLRMLAASGLTPGAVMPAAAIGGPPTNPTMIPWRRLLREFGVPFVKVQLLRDNPIGVDIAGWREEIAATDYPVDLIVGHLQRVQPDAAALRESPWAAAARTADDLAAE